MKHTGFVAEEKRLFNSAIYVEFSKCTVILQSIWSWLSKSGDHDGA